MAGIKDLDIRIPLIAAGGIVDSDDVADYVDRGADGVMLGITSVTTHSDYKSAILESGPNDTCHTWCFDEGWPYSGHRVMRNSTLASWEAEGCPQPGGRPGEGDEIALLESGTCLPRYHMASPVNTTSGAVTAMALYAGTGSARINRLVSAKEVVEELSTKLPLNYTRK